MLELGPFKKDGHQWLSYDEGTIICNDARKRVLPDLDNNSSYILRFYDKKPRCKVIPILVKRYKILHVSHHYSQYYRWKEDKPNRRWKELGSIRLNLIKAFDLDSNMEGTPKRLYVRAIKKG